MTIPTEDKVTPVGVESVTKDEAEIVIEREATTNTEVAGEVVSRMVQTEEQVEAATSAPTLEGLIPEIKSPREVEHHHSSIGLDLWEPCTSTLFESMHDVGIFKENERAQARGYPGLEKALILYRDQIVVDLGAGDITGYYYAALAGAKAYIAVDAYFRDDMDGKSITKNEKDIKRYMDSMWRGTFPVSVKPIPGIHIKQDMLSFLLRLPDNSVSILTSGIDDYILQNFDYARSVRKEIARVLSPKGVHINNGSMCGSLKPRRDEARIAPLTIEGLEHSWVVSAFIKK